MHPNTVTAILFGATFATGILYGRATKRRPILKVIKATDTPPINFRPELNHEKLALLIAEDLYKINKSNRGK